MKIKSISNYSLVLFCTILFFFISINTVEALNYSISFRGSGASTIVESVIVQNLTKGTTVTVPIGSILKLTDTVNSIDKLNADIEALCIYPNPTQSNATLTLNAENNGIVQLKVYTLDGRIVANVSTNIQRGKNSFKLSLPQGIFAIQVLGNGFMYNAKAISQSTINNKAHITFLGSDDTTQRVKVKEVETADAIMSYSAGDQLLYKAISGNCTTVITDKPLSSKIVNFNFVECKDADNNYYSVVTIGTQSWLVQNFKSTHFNDGSPISIQYHSNDINREYGPSYVWNDIIKPNFAPKGWHVPTDAEWNELSSTIGTLGLKLKETGITHWNTANGTNETGFTALGSAHVYGASLKAETTWWSSTENSASDGIRWALFDNGIFGRTANDKSMRFPVRLIKDTDTYKSLLPDTSYINGFDLGSIVEGNSSIIGKLNYGGMVDVEPFWKIAQWNCINNNLLLASYSSLNDYSEYRVGTNGNRVAVNKTNGALILELNASTEYGLNGITSNPRKINEPWPHLLIEYNWSDANCLKIADKSEIRMNIDYTVLKADDKMPIGTTDISLHTAQFQWYITIQNRNPFSVEYGQYLWFGLCFYDRRYDYAPFYAAQDGGKEVNTGKFIYCPDMNPIMSSQGKAEVGKMFKVDINILPMIQAAFSLAKQRNYLLNTNWDDLFIGGTNIGWEVPGTYDVAVEINKFNIKYILP